MRMKKHLIFLIIAALGVALAATYINYSQKQIANKESAAKIKLLKELNFKPHKRKLTLDEDLTISDKNLGTPEFIASDFSAHQQRIDEIIYDGLDFPLGETKTEIIKNLGAPKEITETTITSRYRPDVNDKLFDLIYNGIETRIYHATADEKELVLRIIIESDQFKVKYGLNIGAGAEYVSGVLGEPPVKETDLYEYNDSNGFAKLRFYFDSNKLVKKIEWNFEEN